jgi:hypothetical protein
MHNNSFIATVIQVGIFFSDLIKHTGPKLLFTRFFDTLLRFYKKKCPLKAYRETVKHIDPNKTYRLRKNRGKE